MNRYSSPIFSMIFLSVLLLCMQNSRAFACEEFYPVDIAQAREQLEILKDPEADEFDQIVAFETLVCAERISFRTQAYKVARATRSEAVRAEVLNKFLFDLPVIVFHYRFIEGLSANQRKWMEAERSFSFTVHKKFPNVPCITLYIHSADCNSRAIHQFGSKLQLYWDVNQLQLDMELTENGDLIGEVTWDDLRESGVDPLPVEIRMP